MAALSATAVGRESDQIVLLIEPTGLRFACGDHRQRFVAQASRTPQSERLGGGKNSSAEVLTCRVEGLSASICARCWGGNSGDAGSSLDNKRTIPSRAAREPRRNSAFVVRCSAVLPVGG